MVRPSKQADPKSMSLMRDLNTRDGGVSVVSSIARGSSPFRCPDSRGSPSTFRSSLACELAMSVVGCSVCFLAADSSDRDLGGNMGEELEKDELEEVSSLDDGVDAP
jgi:hypothetical protein